MNHVLFSGFLNRTELIIRCRPLNKTLFSVIDSMQIKPMVQQVLYYDKGIKDICCRCKKKRTVRQDPFQWVSGLRFKACMPRTITHTNAKKMMKKHFEKACKHMKRLCKLSPFGRPMSLFLFADVITETNRLNN